MRCEGGGIRSSSEARWMVRHSGRRLGASLRDRAFRCNLRCAPISAAIPRASARKLAARSACQERPGGRELSSRRMPIVPHVLSAPTPPKAGSSTPLRSVPAGTRRATAPGAPRTGGARDRGSVASLPAPAPLAHTARPCPAAPVAPLRAREPIGIRRERTPGAARGPMALLSHFRIRRTSCSTSTASTLSNTSQSPRPSARTRSSSAPLRNAASTTPARSGTATTPSTR